MSLSPQTVFSLAAGILLAGFVFGCGSSETSEDHLTAPDFVGGEVSGMMIIGEKALGRVWTVDAEKWEIPERAGADGKPDRLPVLSRGKSILEMHLSPDGGTLVLLSDGEAGPVLASYETGGFTEKGTLNLAARPLDLTVAAGGILYLLPAGISSPAGTGLVMKIPATLSAAEAQTLTVTPEARGLGLAPDGEHLLLAYGPGESRFGWLELAGFAQVTDLPWTPALVGLGKYRVIFFDPPAENGNTMLIIPESRDRVYKYSLDQAEPTTVLDLKGLTGGMAAGKLSGNPVLIWVTLAGYLHLFDFGSGCYGDLGLDYSSADDAVFSDNGPVSDPEISKIQTSGCLGVTKTETWTITYTEDGWQVEGSVSGRQPELAREGETYTTAGGELSFLLSPGESPAGAGDAFSLTTDDGITGKYVGAAAPELYLDEARELVWVMDPSGGQILVVDPLTGATQQIID